MIFVARLHRACLLKKKGCMISCRSHVFSRARFLNLLSGIEKACLACFQSLLGELKESQAGVRVYFLSSRLMGLSFQRVAPKSS